MIAKMHIISIKNENVPKNEYDISPFIVIQTTSVYQNSSNFMHRLSAAFEQEKDTLSIFPKQMSNYYLLVVPLFQKNE